MDHEIGLGIDIGGSGIKGAPVNLQTGVPIADRLKIATPSPSTPDAVADIVAEIVANFKDQTADDRPVGVTVGPDGRVCLGTFSGLLVFSEATK